MKLTNRLIKYLSTSTNLSPCIQHYRNTPILAENNAALDYLIYHQEEEYLLSNKK